MPKSGQKEPTRKFKKGSLVESSSSDITVISKKDGERYKVSPNVTRTSFGDRSGRIYKKNPE